MTMTAALNNPYPEQSKLTVFGDRQDGKTYLAELFAITEAFKGNRVLFDCYSMDYAANVLENCADLAEQFGFRVKRVRRTNGRLMIELFSGGCIWFEPVRRTSGRGYSPDVHIIDDVGPGEGHPLAKRILRTVTR
jgi:hypothetical protein